MTPGGLFQNAKDTARDVKEGAKSEATDAARKADAQGETDQEKAEVGKRTLKEKILGGYGAMKDRVPDEHKDRAREQLEDTKQFLREEFPEERRDQYIYRLKKVCFVITCQCLWCSTCHLGYRRVPKAPRLR
jgi:hypothetical protein